MRLRIAAVGRLKAGPERELAERYMDRAAKAGRAVGITRFDVVEYPEGRQARPEDRRAEEAVLVLADIDPAATLVLLDETGRAMTSEALAAFVGKTRDSGAAEIVLAIGGADGHGPALRQRADLTLALGAMTWPHQLVRLLVAEQIYRCVTILSGHPYHRG